MKRCWGGKRCGFFSSCLFLFSTYRQHNLLLCRLLNGKEEEEEEDAAEKKPDESRKETGASHPICLKARGTYKSRGKRAAAVEKNAGPLYLKTQSEQEYKFKRSEKKKEKEIESASWDDDVLLGAKI